MAARLTSITCQSFDLSLIFLFTHQTTHLRIRSNTHTPNEKYEIKFNDIISVIVIADD